MRKIFSGLLIILVAVIAVYYLTSFGDKKQTVIAVISHAPVADPAFEGVKSYLGKSGYIEGKNITYHYGGATGSIDKLASEADRLKNLSPDIFLALSTPATIAAQKVAAQLNVPVVFAPNSDPVGANLVDSLQNPGRNTTGVTFGKQEDKRLEWLVKIAPDAQKICFPYNVSDKSPVVALERLLPLQQTLSIRLIPREIHSKEELNEKISTLCQETDAIFMPTDALIASRTKDFIEFANQHKIALSVPHRKGVEMGATTSYGFSLFDLGVQAGRLIQNIVNGADAGSLPIETAEFKLSLNMTTLKRINLNPNDSILRQAVRID